MIDDYTKAPRIYGDYQLAVGTDVPLDDNHCHYLLSVMRRDTGDIIRVFNGKDGEFIGKIDKKSKKSANLSIFQHIKPQTCQKNKKILYFSPIKKDRMGFLIEKSVELGVTDLCPVITDHTENHKFNPDKMAKQIIEAAEQCERLTIPALHDATPLDACLSSTIPIYCAMERHDAPLFNPPSNQDLACLVGPEGGWSAREIEWLVSSKNIRPVSLGQTILRAETASICMLARLIE